MTRQTLALKANGPRTATWGRNPFAFAGTAFENMSGIHKGLSPADLALEIGWWGESSLPDCLGTKSASHLHSSRSHVTYWPGSLRLFVIRI